MNDLQHALSYLPDLLKKCGLPRKGWEAAILSRRNDSVMHRVVVVLSHPLCEELVLKRVFRPVSPAAFEISAARQAEVSQRFSGSPRILAVDLESQSMLMQRLPGQSLFDLCAMKPLNSHTGPLRSAGAWTARFHQAFDAAPRLFKPNYTRDHLASVLDRVKSRELQMPRRRLFMEMAEAVLSMQPAAEDCGTIAAISHGDLNCRNIIVNGETAAGLDFGPGKPLPVGHDLARLFCHYGALCVPRIDPAKGMSGPLPGVDLSAFFSGYTLVQETDKTVRFLTLTRLLRDWQQMPKDRMKRSLRQTERLTGLTRLAKAALDHLCAR